MGDDNVIRGMHMLANPPVKDLLRCNIFLLNRPANKPLDIFINH